MARTHTHTRHIRASFSPLRATNLKLASKSLRGEKHFLHCQPAQASVYIIVPYQCRACAHPTKARYTWSIPLRTQHRCVYIQRLMRRFAHCAHDAFCPSTTILAILFWSSRGIRVRSDGDEMCVDRWQVRDTQAYAWRACEFIVQRRNTFIGIPYSDRTDRNCRSVFNRTPTHWHKPTMLNTFIHLFMHRHQQCSQTPRIQLGHWCEKKRWRQLFSFYGVAA